MSVNEVISVFRFKPQETGDDTTVEDYFLSKYSYKLKYPCLPLISIGSRVREIKLPIELLYLSIEPQKVSKKLTDKQTSTMIKVIRYTSIQNKMDNLYLFNRAHRYRHRNVFITSAK